MGIGLTREEYDEVINEYEEKIKRLRYALIAIIPFSEWQYMEMTAERNPTPLKNAIKMAKSALEET